MSADRQPDENAALAQLAWALAHSARIELLRVLFERGGCVCGELVSAMDLAQSTVSQHLKILREAGLIRGTVDGPRVCYCANPAKLQELQQLIAKLEPQSQNRSACDGQSERC